MNHTNDPEIKQLAAQYENLRKFTHLVAGGNVRSLLVNGPPGVGKSFMVQKYLKEVQAGEHVPVKGKITPLALFHALYRTRESKSVLVLDDTDSAFKDTDALNILKAVMDTTPNRQVSWESSRGAAPSALNVPSSFTFSGGVILITNVGFSGNQKSAISVHLNAIRDRTFPIQIGSDSRSASMKMIEYIVAVEGMLKQYEISEVEQKKLLLYLQENVDRLVTVSLRTMDKLAQLYKVNKSEWRDMADSSLLRVQ